MDGSNISTTAYSLGRLGQSLQPVNLAFHHMWLAPDTEAPWKLIISRKMKQFCRQIGLVCWCCLRFSQTTYCMSANRLSSSTRIHCTLFTSETFQHNKNWERKTPWVRIWQLGVQHEAGADGSERLLREMLLIVIMRLMLSARRDRTKKKCLRQEKHKCSSFWKLHFTFIQQIQNTGSEISSRHYCPWQHCWKTDRVRAEEG